MKKQHLLPYTLTLFSSLFAATSYASNLEEIVITADFHQNTLMNTAGSVSVLDELLIENRNANHLEEILNAAPNINFSSGASRGRFVQMRGIGERSQFVDPINPSIGMVIDGIDLSGLGGAGTLFDTKQVEVLRGPQGTLFGASALAGAVNISSHEASEHFSAKITSTLADYDTYNMGAVINGALTNTVNGRLAIQQHQSNGYMENDFLNRDDTAERDELTLRGKLNWQINENLKVYLTSLYLDIDNGYDNFTLDNSRNSLADEPGRDTQETFANIVKLQWNNDAFTLEGIASVTNSETKYSYDEDWTYADICTGQPCEGWSYATTDTYLRNRDSQRMEIRLLSNKEQPLFDNTHWVAGIYHYTRDVDLTRNFFDWDAYADTSFISDFETDRLAIYGQLTSKLNHSTTLTLGLRSERFDGTYTDNLGITSNPDEDLLGGEIKLAYQATDSSLVYGLISKGYKTGGVNGSAMGKAEASSLDPNFLNFLNQRLNFDSETLINYELGLKGIYLDSTLSLRLTAFYMDRDDMQLRSWYNEGSSFVGFIDNAAEGSNTGIEIETNYQVNDQLQIFASLGILSTDIDNFIVNNSGSLVDKSGRDQAHAPDYQYNIGGQWQLNNLSVRLEVEGKDEFYYSNSHDAKSSNYTIVHAKIGYDLEKLNLSLWGKNLTDKDYGTRGFLFANDPREFYATEVNYIQLGDPRTIGITATYSF